MIWIITVMAIAFVLLFVLSLLEFVWCCVQDKDVVMHEERHGGPSPATRRSKTLLRQRMLVVNFILLMIHLATYLTPMLLMWLARDKGGLVTTLLVFYGIILFFGGELVAKNIGYRWLKKSAVMSAIPLDVLLWIFVPVTWFLRNLIALTGGQELRLTTEEDVRATIGAAVEHGSLQQEEAKLITHAIALGNLKIRELFIPVAECPTVAINPMPTRQKLQEAASKHFHIMVTETEGGNIVGMITRKDVLAFLARSNGPPEQPIDLRKEKEVKPKGMVELSQDTIVAQAYELLEGDDVLEAVDKEGRTIGILSTRDIAHRLFGIGSERCVPE
ncbi:MAG: CNNM domain-containing protein [Patescibacteria group bacterium]|nr:CNNM domain-containing protein [Patescibacteria group bacterium]